MPPSGFWSRVREARLVGYAALYRGDRRAAISHLREAAPEIPFTGIQDVLRLHLGKLFLEAGDLRAAERRAQTATSRDPAARP